MKARYKQFKASVYMPLEMHNELVWPDRGTPKLRGVLMRGLTHGGDRDWWFVRLNRGEIAALKLEGISVVVRKRTSFNELRRRRAHK